MKVTFHNPNSANDLEQIARIYLSSRIEDFKFFMLGIYEYEDLEHVDEDERTKLAEIYESIGSFYEYGLSFSFKEATDDNDGYFCYLLSTGGGHDEIRFYEDGRVEYVYLDWFCGIGFDVTNGEWAQFLKDFFQGAEVLNFEQFDYEERFSPTHEEEDWPQTPLNSTRTALTVLLIFTQWHI